MPRTGGLNRLDLAKWLVAPGNPLTARVTMNRFWQQYFGLGLVETENDFGTRGAFPSHPELLDWLATEFAARRWSMKAAHRLIVTSATYRQSSRVRPELATIDRQNRLLSRQQRLRLEAEIVRDAALTASGLLARQIGGPGVFPPQPEGVLGPAEVPREWKTSAGIDRYRRGLYTFCYRSTPHPALAVFDAPDSNVTCTRRQRSNTPLAALTLLNDAQFFEMAQGLAGRILREAPPNDNEHLRYGFRLCLVRDPGVAEQRLLAQLLAEEWTDLKANPDEAKRLVREAELPPNTDRVRFAAWIALARVLMNCDEFITRE